MGSGSSDFRYNTGDTKVPWAAVGENYNVADTLEFVKFLMGGKGAKYAAALREVKEEVGIDLGPDCGGLVLRQVRDMAAGQRVNDINDVYLYDFDGKADLLQATTDEVAQIQWMTREEIISLSDSGEMVSVIKDLSYFIQDDAHLFGNR